MGTRLTYSYLYITMSLWYGMLLVCTHTYILFAVIHVYNNYNIAYIVMIIGIDAEMSEEFRIFQKTRKFVYIRHETCITKCNTQSHGSTCIGNN